MNEEDHDKLICLYKRVELTEIQHERDIQRLGRNINTLVAILSIVVPTIMTVIIIMRP